MIKINSIGSSDKKYCGGSSIKKLMTTEHMNVGEGGSKSKNKAPKGLLGTSCSIKFFHFCTPIY